MFQLSFHAANSPAPHLLPEEVDQHSIASRHVDRREGVTEDHPHQAMTALGMAVIVLHHRPDVCRLHEDMGDDQAQETAIWIHTGHARIHDQDRREGLDHAHFRPGLQAGLHPEGTEVQDVGRARRRQGEDGGGARVIRAIPATVTEVAAGAEADMEGAGDDRSVALPRVTLGRTMGDRDQDRVGVHWGW